jgi:hypothetical protein
MSSEVGQLLGGAYLAVYLRQPSKRYNPHLLSPMGCIVGMISTHYRVPTHPTREQLHL